LTTAAKVGINGELFLDRGVVDALGMELLVEPALGSPSEHPVEIPGTGAESRAREEKRGELTLRLGSHGTSVSKG
jgi:hypothetical protein